MGKGDLRGLGATRKYEKVDHLRAISFME